MTMKQLQNEVNRSKRPIRDVINYDNRNYHSYENGLQDSLRNEKIADPTNSAYVRGYVDHLKGK